jgi:predicted RNA methylase
MRSVLHIGRAAGSRYRADALFGEIRTSNMNRRYEPELYDLVTPPSWFGDVEWYRKRAEDSGGPVLELGAGTGRITLPVAQSGVRIYALDSDPGCSPRWRERSRQNRRRCRNES